MIVMRQLTVRTLSAFALAALLTPAVWGAENLELYGFAFGRGLFTGGQAPWISGGFGRLTVGADAADASQATLRGKVHLGADWRPVESVRLHLHGIARAEGEADGGDRFGVPVAFLQFRPELSQTSWLRIRAGTFFPGTSLENVDRLWASPYTITLSALNTWTGEELRLTGLETRYLWSDGRDDLFVSGAAFVGNDTLGTLLAWRGWGMSDRFTTIGEVLPLPPLPGLSDSGPFHKQRDEGTQPIDELDDRIGWMARAGWSRRDVVTMQAAYLDNRGDRGLWDDQYSWDTSFWVAGTALRLGPSFELLAEGAVGNTAMGLAPVDPPGYDSSPYGSSGYGSSSDDPAPARFVDVGFWAGYALLSWEGDQTRVALRFDRFRNTDNDQTPDDDNGEDGHAWTLAGFWLPNDHVRVGAELLRLSAERPAAVAAGADPDTDAWKATLELRLSF